MAHPNAQDLLQEAAEQLPADASVEAAMERVLLLAGIERGKEPLAAGRMVAHDEVKRRLAP